jgi:hypothetical protein
MSDPENWVTERTQDMSENQGPSGLPKGHRFFVFQVDVEEKEVQEADDPDALVDLLDSDALTGEQGGDVDSLTVHADSPAGG